MPNVAFPLPSSISFIASIPAGVAAEPNPKTFAAILSESCCWAYGLSVLKSFLVMGRKSFASFSVAPDSSKISNIPSHTAYIEQRLRQSVSAEEEEESMVERMVSGRVNNRHTKLIIMRVIHIAFMKYCMNACPLCCQLLPVFCLASKKIANVKLFLFVVGSNNVD